MAEDGELESQSLAAPARFPDEDHHLVISSPMAESGELESHGVTRALVSSEARRPWPVRSPCARRESNPHVRRHTLLRRARLPITPPALDRAAHLRPFLNPHVSVSMWQFAHKIRRLSSSLLGMSPSTWSTKLG